MSLHDENGIAPDSGITGPADAAPIDIDLDRDTQLDDDDLDDEADEDSPTGIDAAVVIATDPASDIDAETGQVR